MAKGLTSGPEGGEIKLGYSYPTGDSCSAYVWIDVHRAIRDGIRFFEEVTVAEGRAGRGRGDSSLHSRVVRSRGDSSGVIPALYVVTIVELRDGLGEAHPAKAARLRLIEVSFPGCSRIVAKLLHGAAHSSALVLEVSSYDEDGTPNEPTLLRLDAGVSMRDEALRCREVAELVGPDALKVMRGPRYASFDGADVTDSPQLPSTCAGALVLGTATGGLGTTMPELLGQVEASSRLRTLEALLDAELAASVKGTADDAAASSPASAILKDLLGPGGLLSGLALRRHGRCTEAATSKAKGALLGAHAEKTARALVLAFLPPAELLYELGNEALLRGTELYRPPESLKEAIARLEEQAKAPIRAWGKIKGSLGALAKFKSKASVEESEEARIMVSATLRALKGNREQFIHSFVLETDAEVSLPHFDERIGARAFFAPLLRLIIVPITNMFPSFLRCPSARAQLACSSHETTPSRAQVWGDEACKPLLALMAELSAIRNDPSVAPWLAEWKPLELYQHGELRPSSVIVDSQGASWLLGSSKSGSHEPFRDAAQMITSALFHHLPLPMPLAELKAASASKLSAVFRLSPSQAVKLSEVAAQSASKAELEASLAKAFAGEESKESGAANLGSQIVGRIANTEEESESCLKVGCEIVDALIAGGGGGAAPEIWQMIEHPTVTAWPPHAARAFSFVQSVVRMSFDLARKCSARSAPDGKCVPADIHSVALLLPLLHRGLCSVRYCDLGAHAKRLAWHTARMCATQLLAVLRRPPADPDVTGNGANSSLHGGGGSVPSAGGALRLVAGQPVLVLLDVEADRRLLHGDEGNACLAEVIHSNSADASVTMARALNGKREVSVRYDTISQLVLPWKKPIDADDEFLTIIERTKDEYKMIGRLRETCAGLSVSTDPKTLSEEVLRALESLAPPVPEIKSIALIAEFGARLLKRKREFTLSQPRLTDWIRG